MHSPFPVHITNMFFPFAVTHLRQFSRCKSTNQMPNVIGWCLRHPLTATNQFYLQYFLIVMSKEDQFMKEQVMNAVHIQREAKSL